MVIVDDTVAGTSNTRANAAINIYSNNKLIGPPKPLLLDITVILKKKKKAAMILMNMYIDFEENL